MIAMFSCRVAVPTIADLMSPILRAVAGDSMGKPTVFERIRRTAVRLATTVFAATITLWSVHAAAVTAAERQALDAFYASTNGASWTVSTGWNGAGANECQWFGVECSDPSGLSGNIIAIRLPNNNLTGTLPDTQTMAKLDKINVIELPNNHIGGTIPGISALQKINTLDLSINQFTGTIPALAGNPLLGAVSFARNQLTGSIPSLAGLVNLRGFDVSDNQLTGSIPSLTGLNALVAISFKHNALTGSIPSLAGLTLLEAFFAYENQLTGPIPAVNGLPALKDFLVYSNQLTGSVPSIAGLANLTQFAAYSNQLDGTIGSMTGATKLAIYLLYQNKLTGSIPSLAGLSSLQFFQVENNLLTGSIPPLAGLSNLVFFQAENNQLSGGIPDLTGLTSLVRFGAANNQLTGPIPSLSGLTALGRFVVFKNQLTGSIPPLTGLNNLIQFEVAQNRMTGTLPAISTLPNLQQFVVSGNQFSGPVPAPPASLIANGSDLRYNALVPNGNASDTATWNAAQGSGNNWQATQTVAPANVAASALGTTVNVTWTPITYTGDSGGYEVLQSTTPGGPYTLAASTPNKSASSASVGSLSSNTKYYFVVVTRTDPHVATPDPSNTNNANTVRSANSAEVSATTTTPLAATSTTLATSGSPASQGTTVTFTATIAGGSAPAGTVTFKADGTTMGTGPVQLVGGAYKASFSISNLATGTFSITASYSGDANNAPSTSQALSQVIGPPATTASGTTATGTGAASASFTIVSGGPNAGNCGFDMSNTAFVAAPQSQPVPGSTQPHGQFKFRLNNCGFPPATVRMSVTWPSLAGASYYKFGPVKGSNGANAWYQPANLTINGNTATFDVTDGDTGDGDLTINGTIDDPNGPVIVPAAQPGAGIASEISSAYGGHTCSRLASTGYKCWGLNSKAELGNETTVPTSSPVDVHNVPPGTAIIQALRNGTCLISATGGLKCWGFNDDGEIGNGTQSNTPEKTPKDVTGFGSGVVQVGSTADGRCALTTTGGVKCWGRDFDHSTIVYHTTPLDVPGLGSGVMQIAVGYDFACALMTTGGVKCWGANARAQLGDGTLVPHYVPADVTGLTSGVAYIAAGAQHACALLTSGGLKCWGYNSNGQVGDNSTTNRTIPTDVTGLGSGVVDVAGGFSHTCAALSSGAVNCWGFNLFGQVGDNSTTQRPVPTQVSGLTSGYVAVSGGSNVSCARSAVGGVKCWGANDSSNGVGDGTTVERHTPVDVVGITGGNHSISGFNPPGPPSAPMSRAVGQSLTLTAISSAGLPVTFSTYTPDRCTVSGNQAQFVALGLCIVRASAAGNGTFSAAPDLTRLILVTVAGPTITISPPTLPNGVVNTPYSQTLTASGGTAPYAFTVSAGTLPSGLTLSPNGALSGTPTATGTFNFTAMATDANTSTGTQGYSVTITAAAPVMRTLTVTRFGSGTGTVTSNPPGIQCGATCSADFADGTTVTLTAAASAGSLFAGWSGACAGNGSCVVTMSAARTVNAQFDPAPVPLVLPPAALPIGIVGSAYQITFAATGGTPPYRYAVSGGALPPGLGLNSATGVLSGSPTQVGVFTFQLTATDNANATAAQSYSVTVIAALAAIPTLSAAALAVLSILLLVLAGLRWRRKPGPRAAPGT